MKYSDRLEISDIIVQYEPSSLRRLPVSRDEAIHKSSSRYAESIISAIPHNNGILCENAVDQILLDSHKELQRLCEEFYHAQRISKIIQSMVQSIRSMGIQRKIRLVDIGCGIGYILRWLAANQIASDDLTLIGVDFNAALIDHAQKLARAENLQVEFKVANAFHLDLSVDIFISSGVLHHFPKQKLDLFFEQQAKCKPLGFAHFDPQNSWATPIGSFIFHFSRMRTPLARYDGWLSAVRAHSGISLERAVQKHIKQLHLFRYNPPIKWFPLIRTMTGVIGIDPSVASIFKQNISDKIVRIS